MTTALVLFMAALHQGYLNFLATHPEVKKLFLIDKTIFFEKFRSIEKALPAVAAEELKIALQALDIPQTEIVAISDSAELTQLADHSLISADDEALHWLLLEKLQLPADQVKFDRSHFLRWDKKRTTNKVDPTPDDVITTDQLHQELMGQAQAQADRSADFWRQVGGVIAKDGKVILSGFNRHAPYEQQQYVMGDPRANFSSGEEIHLSTSIHSEQIMIAEAAKRGISLQGADLYTTTYPCPYCARSVAYSGIKRIFFKDGYVLLDGADLLAAEGVEVIKVEE